MRSVAAAMSAAGWLRIVWSAPGHARLPIGRKIAERHVDQQPLLQDAIDRGRDLFLEKGEARIGKVLGLGLLHERDQGVAGPLLILRPKLRESRLSLLRQNSEQVKLDVKLAFAARQL